MLSKQEVMALRPGTKELSFSFRNRKLFCVFASPVRTVFDPLETFEKTREACATLKLHLAPKKQMARIIKGPRMGDDLHKSWSWTNEKENGKTIGI